MSENKEIFRQVGDENYSDLPAPVESLCMNCQKNGITKLLFVEIPHFKKVIVSSFECEHCGNKNERLDYVEPCADKGIYLELKLKKKEDLNRLLLRQETATIIIPHLEFESPPNPERSAVLPIEGLLDDFIESLEFTIERNKKEYPDVCEKIEIVKGKLKNLIDNFEPFTLILNDPSGNSYIENPYAPQIDKDMTIRHFVRNREQNILCKIYDDEIQNKDDEIQPKAEELTQDDDDDLEKYSANMFQFQTNCPMCGYKMDLNVQKTAIPYFKEVLLYCSVCDKCGYKTTEVKSMGEFGEKGTRLTLHIEGEHDLRRETLKSEYCSIIIPEFEIELPPGTIGSSFMTLEGLLEAILKQLKATNPFAFGDTAPEIIKAKINELVEKLINVIDGKLKITLIMDDPTSNSYIQNLCAPDNDPQLTEEKYERSFQQNEDLGLNDMKTENY